MSNTTPRSLRETAEAWRSIPSSPEELARVELLFREDPAAWLRWYEDNRDTIDDVADERQAREEAENDVVLESGSPPKFAKPSPETFARVAAAEAMRIGADGWRSRVEQHLEATAPKPAQHALSPSDVLRAWQSEGSLVHEPTGMAELDRLTDGGPVYGSRWYFTGAPDAGKTALEIQIADVYLARGVTVGLLAVDEEPGDIMTRFLQRRGFTRRECEQRDPVIMARAADALEGLGLRIYDASWTIETAAADIATFAKERCPDNPRAMLGVDSIQVVRSERESVATTVRDVVTARVSALRAVAQRYRLIAVATSEMNRGAYRSIDAADTANDLASAKESGAIEYSARVLLALRSVAAEPDMVEMRIAKNKHGPAGPKVRVHLRLDRRLQELTEVDAPDEVDANVGRAEHARGRNIADAVGLVRVLLGSPGIATRDLAGAMRAELGTCGTDRANTAKHLLGAAIVRVEGPRGAEYLHLSGVDLAPEIVGALPDEVRARAIAARPPKVRS